MPEKTPFDPKKVLEAIFNETQDGLIVYDQNGVIQMVNPAMEKLLGYSKEDFSQPGKIFLKLMPDQTEEKWWKKVWQNDLVSDDQEMRTILMTRKDGQKRWFRCRLSHMANGCRYVHIAGITEHKDIERLKESETSFRVLADQSPNMIFINVNGHVVFANHMCEEIMGYSRDEICGPEFNFLHACPK